MSSSSRAPARCDRSCTIADTPAAVQAEFDGLHQLAVELNGGILIATLALAGLLAAQLTGGVHMPRKRPVRRTSDLQW